LFHTAISFEGAIKRVLLHGALTVGEGRPSTVDLLIKIGFCSVKRENYSFSMKSSVDLN
jgi:hypothetical protein